MNERLGQEPTAEIPFQTPAFEKGEKDYQALSRYELITPALIIDGHEHRLHWPGRNFGRWQKC